MDATRKSYTVNFLYLLGFMDLLGVSMTVPILSRYARELGASPSTIGILVNWIVSHCFGLNNQSVIFPAPHVTPGTPIQNKGAAPRAGSTYGLLQLFSSPIVGYWSDRAGRRHVLIWTLLLSSLGYFILASSTSIFLLFLSRIPTGLFKQTMSLAKVAISDITPNEEHSHVFGRFNAIGTMGFIVGPVIGGHLADLPNGFRHIALTTALIFLVNAALVWYFIPAEIQEKKETPRQSGSSSKSSQFSLFKNFSQINWLQLWDIFLVRFFLGFAVIVYRGNFALTLDMKFQTTGKQVGYIISFSSIIGTLSGFVVGRISSWYNNDLKLLLHVCMLELLSIASVTFAPTLTILVLSLAPLSLSTAIARVCVTNLTIERIQGDEAGAILGCGASVISIARMASPMLGGLAQEVNETGPGVLAMISCGLGSMILIHTAHKSKAKLKKTD